MNYMVAHVQSPFKPFPKRANKKHVCHLLDDANDHKG